MKKKPKLLAAKQVRCYSHSDGQVWYAEKMPEAGTRSSRSMQIDSPLG